MNTDFDFDMLNIELDDIEIIDMEQFGFFTNIEEEIEKELDNVYTTKIKIPHYEITGEEPDIKDLVDSFKVNELEEEIKNADISEEQREFLLKAVTRLYTFNYSNIAEYYAHQDKTMQGLMEKLALVIIDINDAIANGYCQLSGTLEEMMNNENE
jgi:hypothetical protein